MISQNPEFKNIPQHEQTSLQSLLLELQHYIKDIEIFDGFFYNYTIPHISKEFDLLKISNDCSYILNIELKSSQVSLEDIQRQLVQNKYYLQHLSAKEIDCYTYISSTNCLYSLTDNNQLIRILPQELAKKITNMKDNFYKQNINNLFKSSDFLVSPLNTPEKFINNEYFLTVQQQDIKNKILQNFNKERMVISLNGLAGTGKTLLLYDLAKEISTTNKVLLIHCGMLSENAEKIQIAYPNIEIIPAKFLNFNDFFEFSNYKCILVDEAQRIYGWQFDFLNKISTDNNIHCIYSFDPNQTLTQGEENNNISQQIFSISTQSFELSQKIRTNKALAEFIKVLFNLNISKRQYTYDCVEVVFARNIPEANLLIDYYKSKNYTFINYTGSNYNCTSFDLYNQSDINTHQAIGQEFTKVLMVLNNTFFYDENNILRATEHPNPNYLYKKLLLQGVTRTREKLCIIVVENLELFRKILSMKI